MKKNIKFILAMLLAVTGVLSITSCKDDEPDVAKAVLCSVFSLDFEADGGAEEVKVVSDATWTVEAPDWVTVSPTSGTGTTFVTISVGTNYVGNELQGIRKGTVVFKGNTKASEAEVAIVQDGDEFKNVTPCDISGFYAEPEAEPAIVLNATVVATYEGGFVATDGTANINVTASTLPAVGTTNTLYGTVSVDKYGMRYLKLKMTVTGGNKAEAPAAKDITEDLDKVSYETLERVTLTGLYDGATTAINVADKTNRGFVVATATGIDLKPMSSHSITVDAYYLGTAAPAVNLIVVGYTDNGVAEEVYFQDDFEWLAPWAQAGNGEPAGQTVETNNPDANAPQIGTCKSDGITSYEALVAKGYSFLATCAASKTPRDPWKQIYLQTNYLKFGLTGYYSGITFPAMTEVPDNTETIISFDWSSMRQGSGKWDPTELVVIVKNGADEQQFPVPTHAYKDKDDYIWINARIELGTALNSKSEVTIRNADSQWPADGAALRWFIDNVKVIAK